jgi:hypothetical protein
VVAAVKRTGIVRRPADDNLTAEEWALQREWLLLRSGERCESCGVSIRGIPENQVEVQHRRARGMGGSALPDTHKLSNLLILHGRCHREIEARTNPEHLFRGLWLNHEYHDDRTPRLAAETPLMLFSGRRVFLDPDYYPYVKHPDEWGGLAELEALRRALKGTA